MFKAILESASGTERQCCRIWHDDLMQAAICAGLYRPKEGKITRGFEWSIRSSAKFVRIEQLADSKLSEVSMQSIFETISNYVINSFASCVKKESGVTYAAFIHSWALTKNLCMHTHPDLLGAALCCDLVNKSLTINSCLRLTDRRIVEMTFNGGALASWKTISPQEIENVRIANRIPVAI